MGSKTEPRNFRGTSDFTLSGYEVRREVIRIITENFERFGFQPLETPIIELEQTLRGKYGQEGEASWFRLAGKESAGLRYDQTVPLARHVAMNWNLYTIPYRRYVIGSVFRKESPQSGRSRQFVQCDFDTVGSTNPVIDAEIVAMNYMTLTSLGFTDQFQVQVNDRRLLNALAESMGYTGDAANALFRAWDKLSKQKLSEVHHYFLDQLLEIELGGKKIEDDERLSRLAKLGIDNVRFLDYTEGLLATLEEPIDVQFANLSRTFESQGVNDALALLDSLIGMISAMSVPENAYIFNPLLARGLAYYTGPIFETITRDGTVSITGGGRYDNLIEDLGGPSLAASGSSFGLERVIDVMELYGILPNVRSVPTDVFAVVFDFDNTNLMKYLFAVVSGLRLTGVNVEVYTGDTRLSLSKQIDIARRKGIPITLVVGENEMARNQATFKVLETKDQFTVPIETLSESISQYL